MLRCFTPWLIAQTMFQPRAHGVSLQTMIG
jgi:hypothetical protein